jgi:glycosyltransferase involved in cell wall biosynthesis
MRIAIDALGIQNYGGGRSAILSLLEGIFTLGNQHQYCVFLNQVEPTISIYKNNVQQVISPFKNRFLTRMWAQITFPYTCSHMDIAHFTKNLGTFGLNIPSVVTIHDLTTLIHPELFPSFDVWYWKTIEKRTINNASKVIAVSQTTANDIYRYYKVSIDRVKVIYNSIAPHFKPTSLDNIAYVKDKYKLPDRYILHVGRIDLKKKLTLLVETYALAKKRAGNGFKDQLVLVGEVYQKSQDHTLLPTIERLGLSKEVIITGGVPDDDLPPIYSGADVTISTSIHEGFGLSAVESLACGTPLIAYKAGALQEVVGDAAILLETLDQESMALALVKIINDPELRKELSQKGIIRAKRYQSEPNALQTLKLYEEIVNE